MVKRRSPIHHDLHGSDDDGGQDSVVDMQKNDMNGLHIRMVQDFLAPVWLVSDSEYRYLLLKNPACRTVDFASIRLACQ